MGDDSGSKYDLTEIFVIKFVLADIVIIAALLFAGPLYALTITALLVVSVFLTWYLMERVGTNEAPSSKSDPVTQLQERYAAGDLSEREFEEKLDRLLDANERAERAGVKTEELSLDRAN